MNPGLPPTLRRVLCIAALLLAGCPTFQKGPQPASQLDTRRHVRIGGEQIYVKEQGTAGPAVLLIHGYCGSTNHWAMLQPALAKGHRVLAVDLPGFGRSDKLASDYSTTALAARMVKLLDRKGIRQVHLVGHSWGTSIALAMALQHPARVKSVTLIGVWAYEDQLPPFIIWSRARGVGEVLFALFFDQRLDDRMGLSFYNVDAYVDPDGIDRAHEMLERPGYMASALAVVRGMRYSKLEKRYRTIPHRVLILHGEHDPVTRLPWAKRLHGELRDSRMVVIRNAKHMPMFTNAPKVLRALRPFLAGLEPGQAVPAATRDPAKTEPPQSAPSSRPADQSEVSP